MYTPENWFWLADDGRLYSSAVQGLVAEDAPAYLAWREGHLPTPWPRDDVGAQTDEALQEVLGRYGLHVGIDSLKAALKASVDAAAEAERMKYITPGAGQAMTYQQKASEAVMLEDDPAPDPADYPLLSAEVGITAPTLAEVGAVVRAAHGAWILLGAAIEAARLGAKKAIDEAEDQATARAAAEVLWPSPPG